MTLFHVKKVLPPAECSRNVYYAPMQHRQSVNDRHFRKIN